MSISKAAQELGKKGGQAKSPAKTAAARANAQKPRGKWVTAIAYHVAKDGAEYRGLLISKGRAPNYEHELAWLQLQMLVRHRIIQPYAVLHLETAELKA